MDYQRFKSFTEAEAGLPYKIVELRKLPGLEPMSNIRWIDGSTDMFFQMHVGFSGDPRAGDPPPYRMNKKLLLIQGIGRRCSTDTSGAPANQRGIFQLADGRVAVWATGVPQNGWNRDRPVWVAWEGSDGVVRRLEGFRYPSPIPSGCSPATRASRRLIGEPTWDAPGDSSPSIGPS